MKYILFCEKCRSSYSNDNKEPSERCPECKGVLLFSGITKDEWGGFDKLQKESFKEDFFSNRTEVVESKESLSLSTTNGFEGYIIEKYIDIVFGEIIIPNGLLGALTSGTFFRLQNKTN